MFKRIVKYFRNRTYGRERFFNLIGIPLALVIVSGLLYFTLATPRPDDKSDNRPLQTQSSPATRLEPDELIRRLAETEQLEKSLTSGRTNIDALDAYRKLAQSNPESARAWGGLGRCLIAIGDYREAVSALNRACELDLVNAGYLADRGHARRAVRDLRGAIADYTSALRLKPGDPLISNRMLIVAIEMKDDKLYQARLASVERSTDPGKNPSSVVARVAGELKAGNSEGAKTLLLRAPETLTKEQINELLTDPVFSTKSGTDVIEAYRAAPAPTPQE
jgi:tetratricopeptide (TPR) repeat protein